MPYLDKDFKPTIFEYTNVNDYNRLLVYYPRKGGRGVPSCDFTYEILVTPTPTPTSSNTPTPTTTSTPTPTSSSTPTPTLTPTPSTPSLDPDAAAYLADVVASGGTTNPTIEAAVDTLFTDLKTNGLYLYMEAMYPFVGATASSHSINALGNKTYDITWYGGLTHNVSGTTGNGSNGYGDTHVVPNQIFPQDDFSFGVYQTTNNVNNGFNLGLFETANDVPIIQMTSNYSSNYFLRAGSSTQVQTANGGNIDGQYIISRTSSSLARMYRNTTGVLDSTTSYTNGTGTYSSFVWNFSTGGGNPFSGGYSNQEMNFIFFMSKGLNATEVSTLDGIINTFQTSLGRNTY